MPHFTVSQAAEQMAKAGTVSQIVASQLSQADRSVKVADVKRGFEDPQMSCFVIDASPSMDPYRDAVIQGQQVMVNTLRGSSKCRKNALYVGQWLFSGTPALLNPFTTLNANGGDTVTLLDSKNYRPEDGNGTAIYDTVFQVLQDMAANIAYSTSQAIRTTFTIGVITDGDDNRSNIQPDEVKSIVQELTSKGYLTRSLVIGIDNPDLPRAKIEAIREILGFAESIFVGQSASEIRRAFALASQSAVRAQI